MTTDTNTLAKEIVDKSREQVGQLIGRRLPDINRILGKEGEIKLSFGTTVTNRDAEPGAQADKDQRIKTTIAFAEKFTDSMESALDDPTQPDLPLAANGDAAT